MPKYELTDHVISKFKERFAPPYFSLQEIKDKILYLVNYVCKPIDYTNSQHNYPNTEYIGCPTIIFVIGKNFENKTTVITVFKPHHPNEIKYKQKGKYV